MARGMHSFRLVVFLHLCLGDEAIEGQTKGMSDDNPCRCQAASTCLQSGYELACAMSALITRMAPIEVAAYFSMEYVRALSTVELWGLVVRASAMYKVLEDALGNDK